MQRAPARVARSHFDEHYVIPIMCDEIDLTAAGPHLPCDDLHATGLQPVRRHPFSEVAELLARVHSASENWATGAKLRRWISHGPRASRSRLCSGVGYPRLWQKP